MRAPQQGCQLLARLRLGSQAGQVGQQPGQLLIGQVDRAVRPRQLEAAEQGQLVFRDWPVLHGSTPRALRVGSLPRPDSAFFTARPQDLTPESRTANASIYGESLQCRSSGAGTPALTSFANRKEAPMRFVARPK